MALSPSLYATLLADIAVDGALAALPHNSEEGGFMVSRWLARGRGLLLLLVLCVSVLPTLGWAQSFVTSGARPWGIGTTLPVSCTVGDLYFKTDATAGQNLYECGATNVWTQQSGGSSALTVQEIDGSPTGSFTTLKFSNGALTNNGDGSATIVTGVGGGGDASTNTATAVDGESALFSGTSGKILKRDTLTATVVKSTAGIRSAAVAGTDYVSPAGNVATATALAANGANCSAGSFPLGVDASGAVESCTALPTTLTGTANQITVSAATGAITLSIPTSPTLPGTTTGTFSGTLTGNVTGTASLATALAANGANCSAGSFPLGVDASGAAESCTAAATLASTNTLTGRQDATGAASTAPAKTGTSLPGTCVVGDLFFKSDATAGQNLYECGATNTWTQQLAGSGGVALGDSPTWTGKHTFSPTASLGAAGVSTIVGSAQTITLTGANPTTYATIDAYKLGSPTLVGTNPSQTVTLGSTLTVAGPIKSTNVAATTLTALDIPTWNCSTATTCAGVVVNAPTGATYNYAAVLLGGNVGIGVAAPTVSLDVSGDIRVAAGYGIYGRNDANTGDIRVYTVSGDNIHIGSGGNPANTHTDFDGASATVMSLRPTTNELILGYFEGSNPLTGFTLRGPKGSGTNIDGVATTIGAALGTGTGTRGTLVLSAAAAAQASGSTLQTAVAHMTIGDGKIIFNSGAVTPASTGTRYVCINTAGQVSSSASACSGT